MKPPHLDSALERVVAFSDGIFAVAITLLVLNLSVPDLGSHPTDAELRNRLIAMLPGIYSFVLSFVVVAIYWLSHHRLFQLIKHRTRGTLYANLVFLLTICFIPFPTGVIAHYAQLRTGVMFYAASMAIAGLSLTVLWWVAVLRPARQHGEVSAGRYFTLRALAMALVFLSSLPVALMNVDLARLWWLILVPAYFVLGRVYSRSVREDLRPGF